MRCGDLLRLILDQARVGIAPWVINCAAVVNASGDVAKGIFDEMWETARRCSLEKTRHHIHFGGIGFQLNIFHGDLHGYHQIEIEFDSHEEAVAFVPPPWFGREVTEDNQHGNYSLAKFGKPKE
jgi:CYTH domain-containing protein